MTKSVDTQQKNSPSQPTKKSSWLWVLIFRLFLLGLGAGLAVCLGFLAAIFYPQKSPSKPLGVKLWENLQQIQQGSSPSNNSNQTEAKDNTKSSLSNQDPKLLQAKIEQLEQQIKELEYSAQQLGTAIDTQSIKLSLQAFEQQLQNTLYQSNSVVTRANASLQAEQLKVTLPSDILFVEQSSTLSNNSGNILSSIVTDLLPYRGDTIIVAAHADAPQQQQNNQLSFQQAKAVEYYLLNALGDNYRWLVVGYGSSRPLANNDTETHRQLNRRVEIAVD